MVNPTSPEDVDEYSGQNEDYFGKNWFALMEIEITVKKHLRKKLIWMQLQFRLFYAILKPKFQMNLKTQITQEIGYKTPKIVS